MQTTIGRVERESERPGRSTHFAKARARNARLWRQTPRGAYRGRCADNLLALEGLLRRDDIEVLTAISGSGALDILLERDVAVPLIDLPMPEMDGSELATLMRGLRIDPYARQVFPWRARGASVSTATGSATAALF